MRTRTVSILFFESTDCIFFLLTSAYFLMPDADNILLSFSPKRDQKQQWQLTRLKSPWDECSCYPFRAATENSTVMHYCFSCYRLLSFDVKTSTERAERTKGLELNGEVEPDHVFVHGVSIEAFFNCISILKVVF